MMSNVAEIFTSKVTTDVHLLDGLKYNLQLDIDCSNVTFPIIDSILREGTTRCGVTVTTYGRRWRTVRRFTLKFHRPALISLCRHHRSVRFQKL